MATLGVTPKLDETKLTSEQRDKLEAYQQAETQIQTLEDIAKMVQEVLGVLDDRTKDKSMDGLGELLVDIKESLASLNDKESPETPDYAKPVVEAVGKLEKALSTSIKDIDVKPQVNLDAPQVNVAAPTVDLKGVEKVLKTDMPQAFEKAVKLIPRTPETNFEPLLTAWEGISEQLVSIENATRMKPLPGSMTISNLNEVVSELQRAYVSYNYFQFDPNDSAPNYIGFNENVDADNNSADWSIFKLTYSGSDVTSIKRKSGSWTDRVAVFS
jgi:hypothetical protein